MKKVNFMTCGSLLQINMTDDLICIHMSFLSIGDMRNFEKKNKDDKKYCGMIDKLHCIYTRQKCSNTFIMRKSNS